MGTTPSTLSSSFWSPGREHHSTSGIDINDFYHFFFNGSAENTLDMKHFANGSFMNSFLVAVFHFIEIRFFAPSALA